MPNPSVTRSIQAAAVYATPNPTDTAANAKYAPTKNVRRQKLSAMENGSLCETVYEAMNPSVNTAAWEAPLYIGSSAGTRPSASSWTHRVTPIAIAQTRTNTTVGTNRKLLETTNCSRNAAGIRDAHVAGAVPAAGPA